MKFQKLEYLKFFLNFNINNSLGKRITVIQEDKFGIEDSGWQQIFIFKILCPIFYYPCTLIFNDQQFHLVTFLT